MSLKHDLLLELESNRDTDLSGQMLANKFGVSRNAVWKAVSALKQDGYEILSGTNRGYRLADGSDLLSAEGIGRYLSDEARGLRICAFREIDSTNTEAKRMLTGGLRDNALIVSETQLEGRGRYGRSFYSPSRTGIYMTLVIHPKADLADTVSITTVSAVAVVEAIEALTDKKPQIKWVNDIYLDGKKICGILTEAVTDFESGTVQSVVIGIGINISTSDFPEELSGVAASLNPAGVTRNQIVGEIANRILRLSRNLSDRSYLNAYREHSMILGCRIRYTAGKETRYATAIGIDESGGLLIEREDGGREVLHSGEVNVRPA